VDAKKRRIPIRACQDFCFGADDPSAPAVSRERLTTYVRHHSLCIRKFQKSEALRTRKCEKLISWDGTFPLFCTTLVSPAFVRHSKLFAEQRNDCILALTIMSVGNSCEPIQRH
jgi:hypothetical protein